jgi:L-ascorbate metabolism protein UlaG (beta-lactamase superfamily)
MIIEFLGHSGFLLNEKEHTFLFDPFLSGNPLAKRKPEEIKPKYIFVSHAHPDHLGDTVLIGKNANSIVYTTFELAEQLSKEGLEVRPGHLGGKQFTDFGSVKLFLAFHGSGIPGGHACGFVLDVCGKKIYFAGDTSLFQDMGQLSKEQIDVALLPIGDLFTMGPEDALEAVKLIKPKYVIPMHFNTLPLIKQDPFQFKKIVEIETNAKVIVLNPGDNFNL